MDGWTNGQEFSLCSTGLCPLWGRCPAFTQIHFNKSHLILPLDDWLDLQVGFLDLQVGFIDLQVGFLDLKVGFLDLQVGFLDPQDGF